MEDVQHKIDGESEMSMKNVGQHAEMIVADFDGTLNMMHVKVNGKRLFMPSLKDAGMQSGLLSNRYDACYRADFQKYYAIEHDNNLTHAQKVIEMENWWRSQFQNLQDEPLTLAHLKKIVEFEGFQIRKGWVELMRFARDNNIPFVFLSSSGFGVDGIRLFLEKYNLMSDNVRIVSNQLTWSSDGVMTGYKEPIMHSFVDKEQFLTDAGIELGKKVIVIGNSLGDAKMVSDKEGRKVIRFGICQMKPGDTHEKFAKNWAAFEAVFNKVLDDEQAVKPIIRMAENFCN